MDAECASEPFTKSKNRLRFWVQDEQAVPPQHEHVRHVVNFAGALARSRQDLMCAAVGAQHDHLGVCDVRNGGAAVRKEASASNEPERVVVGTVPVAIQRLCREGKRGLDLRRPGVLDDPHARAVLDHRVRDWSAVPPQAKRTSVGTAVRRVRLRLRHSRRVVMSSSLWDGVYHTHGVDLIFLVGFRCSTGHHPTSSYTATLSTSISSLNHHQGIPPGEQGQPSVAWVLDQKGVEPACIQVDGPSDFARALTRSGKQFVARAVVAHQDDLVVSRIISPRCRSGTGRPPSRHQCWKTGSRRGGFRGCRPARRPA